MTDDDLPDQFRGLTPRKLPPRPPVVTTDQAGNLTLKTAHDDDQVYGWWGSHGMGLTMTPARWRAVLPRLIELAGYTPPTEEPI